MKFLKFLAGVLMLAVPFVGWYFLYRSFKQVKPGDMSVAYTWDKATLLDPGIYFYPFPWESYGPTYSMEAPYMDFKAIKRVRILPGQRGVKMNNAKEFVSLEAGTHFIDVAAGETFDEKTGFIDISKPNYVQGNQEVYTIAEGQVAVINTDKGYEIVDKPGRHTLDRDTGAKFNSYINKSPQVVELPALTVMCSDQIDMKAIAMLTYKVTDPKKVIALGLDKIVEL